MKRNQILNSLRANLSCTWTRKPIAALLASCLLGALLPSAQAASDSWTGASSGVWTNGANWLGGNIPGTADTATFNTSSANTVIDLSGGVTNLSLLFDTGSVSYTIGSGGAGAQLLFLDTAGGVTVNPGVGNAQLINATLSLSTNDAATAVISNASPVLLTLAGGVTANAGAGNGLLTLGVGGAGNITVSGIVTNAGAGNLALLKTGSGTATLTNGETRFTGAGAADINLGTPVQVREGTLRLNNNNTNTIVGELVVGGVVANGGPGQNANIIVDSGLLDVTGWLSVGRGNGTGTVSSTLTLNNNATMVYNSAGGGGFSAGYNGNNTNNRPKVEITLNNSSTVTGSGTTYFGEIDADCTVTLNNTASWTTTGGATLAYGGAGKTVMTIAPGASFTSTSGTVIVGRQNGSGTLNLNGTATIGGVFEIGRATASTDKTAGKVIVDGGSLTVENDLNASAGGNAVNGSTNILTVINGGTVNVGTTQKRWLIHGQWDSPISIINLVDGQINLNANTDYRVATASTPAAGRQYVNITGGALTFYADNQTTVGGTGVFDFNNNGAAGVYTELNLDGGTLTVPNFVSTLTTGTRIMNLNGGTLEAAADTTNWITLGNGGTNRLNVRDGGAVISSNGKQVTNSWPMLHSNIAGDSATDGGLIKVGAGTLTLTGTNTYTGDTTVYEGTLALGGNGSINNSPNLIVLEGATLDVSGKTGGYSVPVAQPLYSSGTVNGTVNTAVNSKIYVGPDTGDYATNTFNNNVNMAAGAGLYFDLSSTARDRMNVTGTLALNANINQSTIIHLKAPSGAVNLAATDYVLANCTGITGYAIIQWDVAPLNVLRYYLEQTPTQLILRYSPVNIPVVTVSVSPSPVERGNYVKVTAGVTAVGTVTNVSVNLTSLGLGSVSLVVSNGNVWTNSFLLPGTTTIGNQLVIVTAVDNSPSTGVGYATLQVLGSSFVWDGGELADSLWTSATNWLTDVAPYPTGNFLVFSNSTDVTPVMNSSYGALGVTFDSSAPSFSITASNASVLSLSSNGIVNNSANAQTLNIPIDVTGDQAVNANPGNVAISGVVSGTGGLAKSGAGALTLTGTNTYTGNSSLSAGTLNVNNAQALGTAGTLTISGGTLDNTSAGDVVVVSNKPVAVAGDFVFTGTKNLSFGAGPVELSGSGSSRQFAVNSNTLSVGIVTGTGGSGYGLTKTGSGILTLGATTGGGVSTLSGDLAINAGTVRMWQDVTANGLTGTGIFENGSANSKWVRVTVTNGVSKQFDGIIRNGSGAGLLGLVKQGGGTLTLTNAANYVTDNIEVTGGKLVLNNLGFYARSNNNTSVINGVLEINGANVRYYNTGTPGISLGSAAASAGRVSISSGSLTANGINQGAGGSTAYGELNISGGIVTNSARLSQGNAQGGSSTPTQSIGVYNQTGGTYIQTAGDVNQADNFWSIGIMNLSSNAVLDYRPNALWYVGDQGFGMLNIMGNAQLLMTNNDRGIMINANGSGSGQINLNGGVLMTRKIEGTNGNNKILTFNGGTLKPNANASLVTNLTRILVYTNGAKIDTDGRTVSLDQSMETTYNTGGIMSIPVTSGGSNYISAPHVIITNASGSLATAIAQVNYTLGTVTNILVTCPGIGYGTWDPPTPYLLGGGGAGATCGPATVVDLMPVDGGLTKVGAGTLDITVGQQYTGPTRVLGGTLMGTLGGLNSMKDLIVSNATVRLSPADGSMYAQSVTFGPSSTLAVNYGLLTSYPGPVINLSSSTSLQPLTNTGPTTINISGIGLQLTNYVVIFRSYNPGDGGIPTNGFALGTLPNGVSGYLTNSGTSLDFVVTKSIQFISWYGGDSVAATWSTNWNIDTSTNWYNILYYIAGLGNQYTKYLELGGIGDDVNFSDGTYTPFTDYLNPPYNLAATNVNISTTVVPAAVTVNSASPYDYVFSGTGSIAGAGLLTKTNSSTLTIYTSNSYSGGTLIVGGTVVVTNDSALGNATNSLTIANSLLRFDGSSSSVRPITLTANSVFGVASGSSVSFAGEVSGTGAFSKTNAGSLSLTAATNTYAGITRVNDGTLTLSGLVGSTTTDRNIEIAPNTNEVATMVIATGATVSADRVIVSGNTANGPGSGTATLNQTGGTLNSGRWFAVASNPYGVGTYNFSAGIANVISQLLEVGNFLNAQGTVNLSGTANLRMLNNTGIRIGSNPGAGSSTITQTGGTLSFYSDGGTNLGGTGVLGIGMGTQTNTFTYNLNGGLLQVPQIQGNVNPATKVFNFNGGTLQAVRNNPTFIFDLTSANVQAGGAIIDSSSNNIAITQPLLNAGGGLTKLGTGVLTLKGSNTFQGAISVAAGALLITPAHQYANAVTVADNATFGTIEGSALTVGNVTVSNSFVQFVLTAPTNPVAPLMNVGALTVNGAPQVRLTGNVKTGTYPVIGYTSIGGSGAFNPVLAGSQGISGTLYTNGNQLWVNVIGIGGIVWSGTNSSPNPYITNLWDFSTTTNWLVGSTETVYAETTPPGDSVLFNDIGSGLVLLSNMASPNSLVISNDTKSYTFQGPGSIGGATGITKDGTNSATMSLAAGSYTGDTVVNNGSLSIPGGTINGKIIISTNEGAALNITSAATVPQFSGGAGNNGRLSFGGTLTIGGDNLPIEFNGNVNGGTQALTKNGTNSVTWGGNVTNTGTVTWNGGELNVKTNLNWISGAVNLNAGGGNVTNAGYWRAGALNKYNTNALYIATGATITNSANSEIRFGTMTIATNGIWGVVGEPRFGWNNNETSTGYVYGNIYSSQWLCIGGANNGVGVVNLYAGGSINVGNGTIAANNGTNHFGTVNMYGGVYTNRGTQHIGESGSGTGTFNQFAGNTGFGTLNLGNNPRNTGIYNMYGGNLIQRDSTMQIGFSPNNRNDVGGTGIFTMTNGYANLYNVRVQFNNGTNGTFNQLGGIVNVRNEFSVGGGSTAQEDGFCYWNVGAGAVFNVRYLIGPHGGGASPSQKLAYMTNSGTINITNGGNWIFARWDGVYGQFEQNAGKINFLGGNTYLAFNSAGGSAVGVINHNGGNVTFFSDNAGLVPGGTGYINFDSNTGGSSTNTYNLNAGILTVPEFRQTDTDSVGTLNLNGGTLKAARSNTTFMQGLTAVNINNPSTIDTTNNNITILQPLQGGGALTKTGNGVLLLNSPTNLYTGATTVSEGSLGGSGVVVSPVTVASAGKLAPGGSVNNIGTLTISNNLAMNSGGLTIEVNKALAQSNDVVVVSGSATYTGTGTLTVSNLGAALVVGDKFKVFGGTPLSGGSGLTISYPQDPSIVWANNLATSGEIQVAAIVPPIPSTPTNIVFYVTNSTDLHVEWPSNYLGWVLQSVTNNPRSIGLSNNWVFVPGSETITSTNIPLNKLNGTTFFRMVRTNSP